MHSTPVTMTNTTKLLLVALSPLLFISAEIPNDAEAGSLIIEVENIRTSGGMVWIGLYNSQENYLIKEKAIVEGQKVDHTGKVLIKVPNLSFGNYAIALFHDINNNGELDRNFLGIPSEPYAFSRVPATKWRLPRFDEVRFSFQHSNQVLSTKLKRWTEY